MEKKRDNKGNREEPFVMIEQLGIAKEIGTKDESPILQLQLTMATSSINHEYARLEFDDAADQDQKEALLDYMNECRQKYFEARQSLLAYDPEAVKDFEADLMVQKQKTMGQFNA